MIEDTVPAKSQPHPPAEGWERERIMVGGDEFLDAVIASVAGEDADRRNWARAMVEHENTVADFVVSVRRALRTARQARGLSMEKAAEHVGVSTSTLARLETGATAKIDLKLVTQVALLLGIVPRLDFAAPGAAAAVTVSALETGQGGLDDERRREPPPGTANSLAGAAGADSHALDLRIRNLEERIAAMEHRPPKNGD